MTAPAYTPPDKLFLRSAFDAISPRYDLLNQILSFGMSEAWRERSADLILKEPGFIPRRFWTSVAARGNSLSVSCAAVPGGRRSGWISRPRC